jgi:hypothetical protein
MKSGNKLVGLAVLMVALYLGTTASANTTIPGSAEDPLVTKSYMDEQILKMKVELDQKLKIELEQKLKVEVDKIKSSMGGLGSGGDSKVVVELLQTGQSLIAGAGTEVIVRTGQTIGISSADGNGIADLTAGTDIKGTAISTNHLLLFPRDDGRGVYVVKGPSHLMVRGSYEIK